jgi:hypothetical protein
MALSMKKDETTHPLHVVTLGCQAVLADPNCIAHLLKQLGQLETPSKGSSWPDNDVGKMD